MLNIVLDDIELMFAFDETLRFKPCSILNVSHNVRHIIRKHFNEFVLKVKKELGEDVKVIIDDSIACRIEIFVSEILRQCILDANIHKKVHLKSEIVLHDDCVIFRFMDEDGLCIDSDFIKSHYGFDWVEDQKIFDPIIIPVTRSYKEDSFIKIVDVTGFEQTFKNISKDDLKIDDNLVDISDNGVSYCIRYSNIKQWVEKKMALLNYNVQISHIF